MDYEFLIDETLQSITLEKKEGFYAVSVGESCFDAQIDVIGPNVISILKGKHSYIVYIAGDGDNLHVHLLGQQIEVKEPSVGKDGYSGGEGKTQADELIVKAPMPGKVIKIHVKQGEKVRKNQTLAIVEAMKMENEIKSSLEGSVKKIHAAAGDLVDTTTPIIELAPKPE